MGNFKYIPPEQWKKMSTYEKNQAYSQANMARLEKNLKKLKEVQEKEKNK